MLRVALVLRSTDVRPDFLVLHVFFVHLFCLIMSFAGNRTPGPQWWLWNRALHHLHSNSFKLAVLCVCVWGGHKLDQACRVFHIHGLDCHCVPVGTNSRAWHQLSLCARGHTLVQACPFHTHTHTHTHTPLTVIVRPWTRIRLFLLCFHTQPCLSSCVRGRAFA